MILLLHSVWPAFWSQGPAWPDDGEIDIIEGVNQVTTNSISLHTLDGCQHPSAAQSSSLETGNLISTDCFNRTDNDEGCKVNVPGNSVSPLTLFVSHSSQWKGSYSTVKDLQTMEVVYTHYSGLMTRCRCGSSRVGLFHRMFRRAARIRLDGVRLRRFTHLHLVTLAHSSSLRPSSSISLFVETLDCQISIRPALGTVWILCGTQPTMTTRISRFRT